MSQELTDNPPGIWGFVARGFGFLYTYRPSGALWIWQVANPDLLGLSHPRV